MSIEPMGWRDHLARLQWSAGQHVLISGPTGSGKTTLAADLVEKRGHVIGFMTKQADSTLDEMYADWSVVSHPREITRVMDRVLVQPKPTKHEGRTMAGIRAAQRRVFPEVFDFIYKTGGWCVLVDETLYMSDPKYGNCGSQIEMMHYHGRSAGISMVCLTQRPAWVPKIIYSSASHAYIARTHDSDDLKRLSELANIRPAELRDSVTSLPTRFDWVYTPSLGEGVPAVVNTRR